MYSDKSSFLGYSAAALKHAAIISILSFVKQITPKSAVVTFLQSFGDSGFLNTSYCCYCTLLYEAPHSNARSSWLLFEAEWGCNGRIAPVPVQCSWTSDHCHFANRSRPTASQETEPRSFFLTSCISRRRYNCCSTFRSPMIPLGMHLVGSTCWSASRKVKDKVE